MKTKLNKSTEKGNSKPRFFSGKNDAGFFAAQATFEVREPGDRFETEADLTAEKFLQNNHSQDGEMFSGQKYDGNSIATIQEKQLADSVSPLVQKQVEEVEEEELMPKSDGKINSPDLEVEEQIKSEKGNGNSLEQGIRSEMEQGFGADFSEVKIHTGNSAVQLNNDLKSRAFTTGNDIFFNQGQFQPKTQNGKRLLAHELTHTIQQGASGTKNQVQRWPWSLTLEQQKALFRSRNYGPITYRNPDISGSGFEASYFPMASQLNVRVRGKVRFADALIGSGGSFSSPNHFMNQSDFIGVINSLPANVQSRILPNFQWTDTEKEIHINRFRENLVTATQLWMSPGFTFQVNETGWEDITASPDINVSVSEGDAVHQTAEFNILGFNFNVTDPASSDHIQVEIVKQPSAADAAEIIRIIDEHNTTAGSAVAADEDMIRGVRSYVGNDPSGRSGAPEGFNNLMSLRSNSLSNPDDVTYLDSVFFENNEGILSEEAIARLNAFFSDPMILLNNEDQPVQVRLNGYASAPGTTNYNRALVEQRLNSVSGYIFERIANSNINYDIFEYNPETTNFSDETAETDLASNPESHDPASFRRVDITITRKGRGGQNTFAHELGHVFGLGDEYESDDRAPNSRATHHQLARNAGVTGGARVRNDDRLMSTGNRVTAAHYSTFADALNQLTSKRWKILTP